MQIANKLGKLLHNYYIYNQRKESSSRDSKNCSNLIGEIKQGYIEVISIQLYNIQNILKIHKVPLIYKIYCRLGSIRAVILRIKQDMKEINLDLKLVIKVGYLLSSRAIMKTVKTLNKQPQPL